MRRLNLATAGLAAGLLLTTLPALGGTLMIGDAYFETNKNEDKHPEEVATGVLIPGLLPSPEVCIHYENNMKQGNRGKISVKVQILQPNGNVQTVKLSGKVKNNTLTVCKKAPKMKKGFGVTFDMEFEDFPRMRKGAKRVDTVHVAGVVASGIDFPLEEPEPEPAPVPPPPVPQECPDPEPAPAPDPPPPTSGPLSASDQNSILRLRAWPQQGRGVALRFEHNGVTIDYRLGNTPFHRVPKYSTITAAVNHFFRIAPK